MSGRVGPGGVTGRVRRTGKGPGTGPPHPWASRGFRHSLLGPGVCRGLRVAGDSVHGRGPSRSCRSREPPALDRARFRRQTKAPLIFPSFLRRRLFGGARAVWSGNFLVRVEREGSRPELPSSTTSELARGLSDPWWRFSHTFSTPGVQNPFLSSPPYPLKPLPPRGIFRTIWFLSPSFVPFGDRS